MNKIMACTAAIAALIAAPAFAADMPVKAPPPAPAPVYNWTGWYVGGNVGYGWGDAHTDLASNGTFLGIPQIPNPGPLLIATNFAFADTNTARLRGVIGGGQIGFNYQFKPNWVLGLEADIQGSGERGSGQFGDTFLTNVCIFGSPCSVTVPVQTTALTNYAAKIDWFGTVRGRLGFLVGDQLFIYATGGLAYGKVAVSGSVNSAASITNPPCSVNCSFSPAGVPFAGSSTNVGFAVGGGLEGRFSSWLPANWTWKLEYLYLDLGSIDTTTSFAMAGPGGTLISPGVSGTINTHTRFTDNIVRVGLNYQFH